MKKKKDSKKINVTPRKLSKYESKEQQEKKYNEILKENLEYLKNTEWKYQKKFWIDNENKFL